MIKGKSIFTTSLWALAVACAMAALFAPPAMAQTAGNLKCNGCVNSKDIKNKSIKSRDIKNGTVKGADLKADIALGTGSNDGDLGVKNTAGAPTVNLDGATGNVTNRFSNSEVSSNGLVKAWAQIAADGSVIACWRCNRDPNETRNLDDGQYEVDFSPLSTDIRERPRSATLDSRDGADAVIGHISLGDRDNDSSSLFVLTANDAGTLRDQIFTVFIY